MQDFAFNALYVYLFIVGILAIYAVFQTAFDYLYKKSPSFKKRVDSFIGCAEDGEGEF